MDATAVVVAVPHDHTGWSAIIIAIIIEIRTSHDHGTDHRANDWANYDRGNITGSDAHDRSIPDGTTISPACIGRRGAQANNSNCYKRQNQFLHHSTLHFAGSYFSDHSVLARLVKRKLCANRADFREEIRRWQS
jgi:hypothetical protein